ncbi:MerR family transcriptional regulator [Candidatus Giovannonibacteria bacterium]|nr:MerR family transcriptional regulator [Candidatus Giovannonibacteria bacterium]
MSAREYSEYLKIQEAAFFLGVSNATMRLWDKNKKLEPSRHPKSKYRLYKISILQKFKEKRKKKYHKSDK